MANSRICSIDGCGKPHCARGWCQGHYVRWKTHGNPLRGGAKIGVRRATCSVGGCNRKHVAGGYCGAHYQRVKATGKAGAVDLRPYGEALQWLMDHADYGLDDCLIWPFSCNDTGYGQLNNGGRTERAHRRMCIIAHGRPPFRGAQAAHSCGRGSSGCVNPRHLRWATRQENMAEMSEHGHSNRGSKSPQTTLVDVDVRAIRLAAEQGESQRSISQRYGISQTGVSLIVRRKNWGWLD